MLHHPVAAFAIHLEVVDPRTGERVLPIFSSENYFTLKRGESRTVTIAREAPSDLDRPCRLVATPFNAPR